MSINILPLHVIKQIAAGQMIENPASVVKELIENSLDAGASSIDLHIESGGKKLIRISDNADGIPKHELIMAVKNHTTSKIMSLDDLNNITTLGFRGEALAVISSVSRFTLTSRVRKQNSYAWEIYIEQGNLNIDVKPAAHPIGTTVEVLDLFFNVPARKKFLKTEKTEFTKIEAIFLQFALAYFDVSFSLTHNGILKRHLKHPAKNENRLITIYGSNFIKLAIPISYKENNLSLDGWIIDVKNCVKKNNIKYFYVNGRIIHNKFINYIISQVFKVDLIVNNLFDYIIYFTIDPDQVDINIHPNKCDIRFYQARLVHDFIYKSLLKTLLKTKKSSYFIAQHSPKRIPVENNYNDNHFLVKIKQNSNDNNLASNAESSIKIPEQSFLNTYKKISRRVLTIVKDHFALIEQKNDFMLLSLHSANILLRDFQFKLANCKLETKKLLMPVKLKLTVLELVTAKKNLKSFREIGIQCSVEKNIFFIYAIPTILRLQNLNILIQIILNYFISHGNPKIDSLYLKQFIITYIKNQRFKWSEKQAIRLLIELEQFCPQFLEKPANNLLQMVNFDKIVQKFKHE